MAKKRCARCGEEKFQKDFSPNPNRPDGLFAWCKACKNEYQKDYVAFMKESAPEAYRAQLQQRKVQSRYGLPPGMYEAILEVQGGVCAGCGREPQSTRNLDIDHKHTPGDKKREAWERAREVRGLLCHRCNRLLGLANDNPDVLRNLAEYLEHPPAAGPLGDFFERVVAYLVSYGERKPKK